MKIFLAGASGVIGRLLLPMLVEAGHQVTSTTRDAAKTQQITNSGGRPVVLDVLDRGAVFAALDAEKPDVVIHQLTDLSQRDFAGNSHLRIAGTRNLVDAALRVGVGRMIAQSIAWVYVPGTSPAQEAEPLHLDAPPPRGEMVAAVHALEQAASEMPIGVILRYGLFYGDGTWFSRNGLTSEQIQRGEITATDGITSFIHVADAASAALLALDWEAGAVNIVDDAPAPGREWVPLYAQLIGAPSPPIKSGGQAWERGASNAKARRRGWQPRYPTWREGFQAVLRLP